MRNKKMFQAICSMIAVALIISTVTFASKVSANGAGQGALLLLTNVSLSYGTYAYADGPNGVHYPATILGNNRVLFPNTMPAGNYHIVICGLTPNGPYNYLANGFYYNGAEQSQRVDLVKGFCNAE